MGGESEDESRHDQGGPSGAVAPGNGGGLASDAASSDPTAPSAAGNDASSHGSRRAASYGGERERGGGGGGGGGRARGGRPTMEEWDFERLARTPILASAFEDFSRKALCHESVLFLIEVSR